MRTTLNSGLFAATMLVCLAAQAAQVDDLNGSALPGYTRLESPSGWGSTKVTYVAPAFDQSAYSIGYAYTPSFDYTLTGLFTRFSTAGVLPGPGLYNKVEVAIYEADTFLDSVATSGALDHVTALASFSFDLVPGTVSLVPSVPGALATGTQFLGGTISGGVALSADTTYIIQLKALSFNNLSLSLSNYGVNTASANSTNTSTGDWVQTYSLDSTSKLAATTSTNPIFTFQGTPITPVPEPSTYGLFGAFGLLSFAAVRRRLVRKS